MFALWLGNGLGGLVFALWLVNGLGGLVFAPWLVIWDNRIAVRPPL